MININDINFKKLQKLSLLKDSVLRATESDIYHNQVDAYKIYKNLENGDLVNKKEKIKILLGIKSIEGVVMPKDCIVDPSKNKHYDYSGYIMDYIDSYSLYDYFETGNDKDLLMEILYSVSLALRGIHKCNIIVTDLSFDNIVVGKSNNKPYFIDIDGCTVDGIIGENISCLLYSFMYDYKFQRLIVSENRDRLSLILSTANLLLGSSLENNSSYEIIKKMEEYDEIGELTKIFLELVDKDKKISDVPYLDEVVKVKRKV